MISELDAINQLLSVTGDAPVSSIGSTYDQAVIARRILREVSTEKQAKGYWFNEMDNYTIVKDSDGFINLPADTLRCDIGGDKGRLVQRGLRIYDKVENSYVIGENIIVDLVVDLKWTLLPQSFRQFIIAHASLRYSSQYFGSDTVQDAILQDIQMHSLTLIAEDIDNRDINMLENTRSGNIAFRNRR